MPVFRSRLPKLNHADTILYEIYMLRFTARRLVREKWEESQDAWVYLESFLVHYRNLIEFLGKKNNVRDTDLHIMRIWGLLIVPQPNEVDKIHAAGAALWQEYEEAEDRISRYLQHCTVKRIESKNWLIDVMGDRIEPLLVQIEPILQSQAGNSFFRPVEAVQFSAPHLASTQVYTPTASAMMVLPETPPDESE